MAEHTNKIAVVVLAAGKGKRMNNPNIPKVLAEINDKPLISFVLDTVSKINPAKNVIIVGHQKELLIDYIKSSDFENVTFAVQEEQLGTGHAVAQAKEELNNFTGSVLILAGDVPLLTAETLLNFIENHTQNNAKLSVLSTVAPNPTGYGRIIRGAEGTFQKIIEHKDATDEQRLISEINSGIFLVESKLLFDSLEKVSNSNAQGEYYLTDIVEIAKNVGQRVIAFPGAEFDELQGVNSPEDLMNAEKVFLNKYGNN